MTELLVPLSSKGATDANRFGPKAANLAALGEAGLPIPGGYCLDAQAYRIQLASLGLADVARRVFADSGLAARRSALQIKIALMDGAIHGDVEGRLIRGLAANRSNEDRGPFLSVGGGSGRL